MKKWLIITISALGFSSLTLYAQDSLRLKSQYQIGFHVGPSYNFTSKPCCKGYVSGMYLRKYISKKIAVEAGVNYQSYQLRPSASLKDDVKLTKMELYTIDVPVSVDYFILPRTKKLNTYVGAGIITTLIDNTATTGKSTDKGNTVSPAASKKANMQFTHGVVYEVNTRLQVNESIHFIPKPGDNCLTFDIGVGYKF